jgi:hypothetical protein
VQAGFKTEGITAAAAPTVVPASKFTMSSMLTRSTWLYSFSSWRGVPNSRTTALLAYKRREAAAEPSKPETLLHSEFLTGKGPNSVHLRGLPDICQLWTIPPLKTPSQQRVCTIRFGEVALTVHPRTNCSLPYPPQFLSLSKKCGQATWIVRQVVHRYHQQRIAALHKTNHVVLQCVQCTDVPKAAARAASLALATMCMGQG